MSKVFVKVMAEHDQQGKTKPLALVWTNDRQYEIDRMTDVRLAPSLKGGGLGMLRRRAKLNRQMQLKRWRYKS